MRGVHELGRYRLEAMVSSAEADADRRKRGRSRIAAVWHPHSAVAKSAGDVYVARDTTDRDKRVAVKLLGPQPRTEVLTALSRDIRTIAARKDTRLPVLDVVDCGKQQYALTMAYVKAPSLAELIDDKPLRPRPAVAKAAGIAAVLVEAGVPHGCLRPSNILVDGQGRVYVVGWDTARLRGGTPRPADDVRGLAAVLLSMLLGRAEVDDKAVDAPAIPEGLRSVIRRGLTGGDYTNVAEFVRAANEADEPEVEASPRPLPPPLPPPAPRRTWAIALSAVVVVVLVGALTMLMRSPTPPRPDRMDVGGRPVAVLAAASGSVAYVANFDDGIVTEIDGSSLSRTFRVPGHPAELALDPAGTQLYVGDPTADSVATVDLATGVVVRTVRVAGPRSMFVGPSGRLYVAASTSHSIAVLDPAGGTTTVPVPGTPVDVVAGPDATSVSVVTQEPAAVLTLDTATNRVTVSMRLDDALVPEQAVTAPNGVVYLSDPASSVVTVVDLPNRHTGRIPLAGRVRGLALSVDGHRLYATLEHPASLVSVDLTAAASPPEPPEPLPDAPDAVAVTADGQEVLVALPRRAQVVRLTPPGPK